MTAGRRPRGPSANACARGGCEHPARWRPVLVILREGPPLRVEVPADVCDRHRRSVRALLARRALPRVEAILEAKHVSARVAIYRIEFRPLA